MLPRKENIIVIKSEAFADRITKMSAYLLKMRKGDKDMLRQISRSGTSIGANIAEGIYAQSAPDFISKFSIAIKEANETRYWLDRLHKRDVLKEEEYKSMHSDNMEIIYMLTSIIRTMKAKQQAIEEARKGEKIHFQLSNNDVDSDE